MRLRLTEKFCDDGTHKVPVARVTDADHKRVYVDLACGHSTSVYVGSVGSEGFSGKVEVKDLDAQFCHQCECACRVCDEDHPHVDHFTELYVDLGGG